MTNRDVQLCGIAWLHPEIPFCTQTGLLLLKRIDNTTYYSRVVYVQSFYVLQSEQRLIDA